jgi:hypothetical protein
MTSLPISPKLKAPVRAAFRRHCHRFLATGYNEALRRIQNEPDEETDITGYICEALEKWFRKNPQQSAGFFIKDDPPLGGTLDVKAATFCPLEQHSPISTKHHCAVHFCASRTGRWFSSPHPAIHDPPTTGLIVFLDVNEDEIIDTEFGISDKWLTLILLVDAFTDLGEKILDQCVDRRWLFHCWSVSSMRNNYEFRSCDS